MPISGNLLGQSSIGNEPANKLQTREVNTRLLKRILCIGLTQLRIPSPNGQCYAEGCHDSTLAELSEIVTSL